MSAISRLGRAACAALLFAAAQGSSLEPTFAQPSSLVDLQDEGFVRRKDGSYVLSSGHFNLNHGAIRR